MVEADKQELLTILQGGDKVIAANIDHLARVYKEETGNNVCKTCPSSVIQMILTLKIICKMSKFKFKSPYAQYKNKKGDKFTISNSTMTDEKAIEFLSTRKGRIELFSEYPDNWEELLKKGSINKDQIEIEAEKAVLSGDYSLYQKVLEGMQLSELREKFPDIKARSSKDFAEKVVESLKTVKK